MSTASNITDDALLVMDERDCRYELVDGALISRQFKTALSGEISATFCAKIWIHISDCALGTVCGAGTGVIFGRQPDTVLAPDVAFIRSGRLPADRDKRKFVETIPDLVVEVISPSERPGDISNKVTRYLDAGVQLVWVVYPDNRMISIYRANRTWESVQFEDSLDGEDVLPGFSLPLSELFDGGA